MIQELLEKPVPGPKSLIYFPPIVEVILVNDLDPHSCRSPAGILLDRRIRLDDLITANGFYNR